MDIDVWRLGPSLYQRPHYILVLLLAVLYCAEYHRLLETWERPRRLFGESYVHCIMCTRANRYYRVATLLPVPTKDVLVHGWERRRF